MAALTYDGGLPRLPAAEAIDNHGIVLTIWRKCSRSNNLLRHSVAKARS